MLVKLNLKYFIFVLVFIGFLVSSNLIFDEIDAKKSNDKSKKKISICCTWGHTLEDGTITYAIKNGDNALHKIVKSSLNDWEDALSVLQFQEVDDSVNHDISIDFKKGKGKKVGKTITYFDNKGFINHVEISLSKKSYGVKLDKTILEHITKHEIGHSLGLGHANFKNTLMSPVVNEVTTKISKCEIDAVKNANEWKFENNNSPSSVDKSFKCK